MGKLTLAQRFYNWKLTVHIFTRISADQNRLYIHLKFMSVIRKSICCYSICNAEKEGMHRVQMTSYATEIWVEMEKILETRFSLSMIAVFNSLNLHWKIINGCSIIKNKAGNIFIEVFHPTKSRKIQIFCTFNWRHLLVSGVLHRTLYTCTPYRLGHTTVMLRVTEFWIS